MPRHRIPHVEESGVSTGITVFHGSHHKFESLDTDRGAGDMGKGSYFAEDPSVAESYGPHVTRYELRPKKALDMFDVTPDETVAMGKWTGINERELSEAVQVESRFGSAKWGMAWHGLSSTLIQLTRDKSEEEAANMIASLLQKKGYDAVRFPFYKNNERVWVVYSPDVITHGKHHRKG